MTRITDLRVSTCASPPRSLDGSDAMNPDPDYSAAYVILETDAPGLEGHGLTFTIGRGNEICCAAIEAMRHLVVGARSGWVKPTSRRLLAASHRRQPASLDRPRQGRHPPRHRRGRQRRLGSLGEAGRQAGLALVADMSPEEIAAASTSATSPTCITPEEALALLRARKPARPSASPRSSGGLSLLHHVGRLARL
jgi:L-fuconate dehydratase